MTQDVAGNDALTSSKGYGQSKQFAHAESPKILPQFALDAVDAKIAGWSSAIVTAADAIDQLVSTESLPVPESVRDLAASTTQKLRSFGTAAGEQEAASLVAGLQRYAAAHPGASIGVGAAIGATLATLLVRLAPSANGDEAATVGASKEPSLKSGSV